MSYKQRVRMQERTYGSNYKDIGVTKKVSVTLVQEDWTLIDDLISAGEYKSRSDYFRQLHLLSRSVGKRI